MVERIRQAITGMGSLLRRRTSPSAGTALLSAAQRLDQALGAPNDAVRAQALNAAQAAVAACLAVCETSRQFEDRALISTLSQILALLAPPEPVTPPPPPTPVPAPAPIAAPVPAAPPAVVEQPMASHAHDAPAAHHPVGVFRPRQPEPVLPPPVPFGAPPPAAPAPPAPKTRPIAWDIFEEHLEEAAFLWGQWEEALVGANYTLVEVAMGPEERLLAHLDGLVLGGEPVAKRLLLPALEGDEAALVKPAAWALLAAEDTDHFDVVLAALASADAAKAAILARAFGLSRHPAIPARLGALFANAEGPLRATILEVLGNRDLTWAAMRLPETIVMPDLDVLRASLRLLRRIPNPQPGFLWYVEHALAVPDPLVHAEALATAFVLGSGVIWDVCRQEAATPGTGRLPLALLALSPDPRDRVLVRDRLRDPASARDAVFALGFCGDLESADAAASLLGDKALGPMAAESFSVITGLPIDGRYRAPGVTAGPDVEEVGPDDPPPEVRPEDFLPAPAPAAVAAWWQESRGNFQPGQRYLGGQPRTPPALGGALVEGAMWRRPVLALELAVATRSPVLVETRDLARDQARSLAALPRSG